MLLKLFTLCSRKNFKKNCKILFDEAKLELAKTVILQLEI